MYNYICVYLYKYLLICLHVLLYMFYVLISLQAKYIDLLIRCLLSWVLMGGS